MTKKLIDPARPAAFEALLNLWQDGGIINEQAFKSLPQDARARAFRLTREVLRHEAGFDRIIKNFAAQKPFPPVRAISHLALFELLIDNAAPHGVIDQWVEIAKTTPETRKTSGFINALLRKTAQDPPKLIPTNQFGKALRKHLQETYSASQLDAINKIQSHYPRTDLRLRHGENIALWAQALNADAIENSHSIRLREHHKISDLDGYAEGKWWVQDIAASFAVDIFSDVKGKSVLDLCAAPGGKTLQLADLGAKVTAVEISAPRAKRISQNLERMGLSADLEILDALEYNAEPYDAVLLDAPCSATGTIRRHPDIRFDDPLGRVQNLIPLQTSLLTKAWSLLKAGGELVYCTCSLLPEEGEAQIDAFLKAHEDATLAPVAHPFTGQINPTTRILPNECPMETGCDGFFVAKLHKAP